jgi:hypothetical protein
MIGEPRNIAERVSQQFYWLVQAAFQSAAAVMIVPSQIGRAKGPIVAIAATMDDPSIAVAAGIARAADEELVIIDVSETAIDEAHIRALAADKGLAIKHIIGGRITGVNATSLAYALRPLHERLVVMTRRTSDNQVASLIAAEQRVPVMVVEPAEAATKVASTAGE